jgi:hypothetical protein
MPGLIRRLIQVIASVALLSAAVLIMEATAASAATTWSAPSDIDGSNALASVSCPNAGFCAAVDYDGNALTYNGSSWSSPSDIDGSNALASVSCPSASFCAAVDYAGNALTYNGSSWSSPSDIDGSNILDWVSCPSAAFCAAVDAVGNDLTYNGSSWSSPSDIDATSALDSVSCPSASFCAAVDAYGNDLTYNGSSWSSPSNIDANALDSVSCPSAGFCTAVDIVGNALTYNGSTWSSLSDIDGDNALDSVSCPSTGFCAAVDIVGNALTPAPAPTVSKVSPSTGPTTGGTLVTITGTNFTGATTVLFGSVAGTNLTVVSPTQITVDSPAQSAGLRNVFVKTPGGKSAAGPGDGFNYVVPPPTVTKVSPSSGPTTGGTLVTITGTNFTGATTVLFGTVAGTNLKVVSATQITVDSPAQSAGLRNVFVKTPGGKSAAGPGDGFNYK